MLDKGIIAENPISSSGFILRRMWQVMGDASYKPTFRQPRWKNADGYIAIRTHTGQGWVDIVNMGRIHLSKMSVVIIKKCLVECYGVTGDAWGFWWLEFLISGPLQFELNRAFISPEAKWENQLLLECFEGLESNDELTLAFASSQASSLIHRWHAKSQTNRKYLSPEHAMVDKAIKYMRNHLSENESIDELAAKFGMSGRWFGKIFREIAGSPPKKYWNKLRINTAAELLRMKTLNVTQIAERLGYSSPFHFSRSFKQWFGKPPSKI